MLLENEVVANEDRDRIGTHTVICVMFPQNEQLTMNHIGDSLICCLELVIR